MQFLKPVAAGVLFAACLFGLPGQAAARNVIIFVADGLRSHAVTPETSPALAALRAEGVDFANSHSLYPTITTPNASAIATGHLLADTGDFGNTIYTGVPLADGSIFVSPEDDRGQRMLNEHFAGDFLGETTLLEAARAKGYATAALGKFGPVGIQDVTSRDGLGSIVLDDATGDPDGRGIPLAPPIAAAITAAGLPARPPGRDQDAGAFDRPGTLHANVVQQDWFVAVATRVLLPRFKAAGKPFVMVFWSRDPDGTQHDNGDSLNTAHARHQRADGQGRLPQHLQRPAGLARQP